MQTMMNAMAGSGMMGIMMLLCAILFVVLSLAAIVLVKHLFFSKKDR